MSELDESGGRGHVSYRLLPWLLVGFYLAMTIVGLILQFVSGRFIFLNAPQLSLLVAFMLLVTAIIGGLLASRQARHPAGWIWLIISLAVSIDQLSFGYANFGLYGEAGSLPGVGLALLWQSFNALPIGIAGFTILLLTFPDGRLPTASWRIVAVLEIASVVLYMSLTTVRPGPFQVMPYLDNPRGASETIWRVLDPAMWVSLFVALGCLLAAVASLFVRLRQSRGADRQYIKWLIFMMSLFILGVLIQQSGYALSVGALETLFLVGFALQIVSFAGITMTIVIAIYRYHLYDIDIIINRTLVYGSLTLLLSAIYFGSVILLQRLFQAMSNQESPLAVVLSTLLIAALFSRLRGQVQAFIDRRFYRGKYDAVRTLAAFARTARDEVDLSTLTAELRRTVVKTIQPVHLSIWLKEESGNR